MTESRTPRTQAGISALRIHTDHPDWTTPSVFADVLRTVEEEAASLNVERLATAIHEVGKRWYLESGEIEDKHLEVNSDQLAADIAAEYARLASQSPANADEGSSSYD